MYACYVCEFKLVTVEFDNLIPCNRKCVFKQHPELHLHADPLITCVCVWVCCVSGLTGQQRRSLLQLENCISSFEGLRLTWRASQMGWVGKTDRQGDRLTERETKNKHTHSSPHMSGHKKVGDEVVRMLLVANRCPFPPSLTAS